MRCPVCNGRIFLQKKWRPEVKEINFETREIKLIIKRSTRKFNYCANCGFRLYGRDVTRLNKELKYLEDVD